MARHENTTSAIEDALNASQAMFTANPLFLNPQAKHIFEAQERIWDQIEDFSTAWFRRRQDATQAIIAAGRRLAAEGRVDPSDLIRGMAEFQMGAIQRLSDDARECGELLSSCAQSLGRSEMDTMKEAAANTHAAVPPAKARPA